MCLSSILSASMYDRLTELKNKNCNFVEIDSINPSIKTALINKFSLTGTGNCYFVVDYPPFNTETVWLLLSDSVSYAEIDYITNNSKEYLFILGKNSSALDKIANLTANYETYQYYLKSYGEDYPYYTYGSTDFVLIPESFWDKYDPTYIGPKNQDCINNGIESVYSGNSGSYQDNETVNFNSYCIDENNLNYNFCFANSFITFLYHCTCVNGKCIAHSNDVFYYFDYYYHYRGPNGRVIDDKLVDSAVKSWINN